jgi:hypothetical protein
VVVVVVVAVLSIAADPWIDEKSQQLASFDQLRPANIW